MFVRVKHFVSRGVSRPACIIAPVLLYGAMVLNDAVRRASDNGKH